MNTFTIINLLITTYIPGEGKKRISILRKTGQNQTYQSHKKRNTIVKKLANGSGKNMHNEVADLGRTPKDIRKITFLSH